MRFFTKWTVSGLLGRNFAAGETFEAKLPEVAHLISKEFGGLVELDDNAPVEPCDLRIVKAMTEVIRKYGAGMNEADLAARLGEARKAALQV